MQSASRNGPPGEVLEELVGCEKLHGRTEAKVGNDVGEQSWGRRRGDPSQAWAVGVYEGSRV